MDDPTSKAKRVRRSKKADNATQPEESQADVPTGYTQVQYITEEDMADDIKYPMPFSKELLSALKAIYFAKAIWSSHDFTLDSLKPVKETRTTKLTMKDSTKEWVEANKGRCSKSKVQKDLRKRGKMDIKGPLSVVYLQYLRT